MVMEISNFSYKDFASTLSKARIKKKKNKYTCYVSGCYEVSLKNSHIVPQCVFIYDNTPNIGSRVCKSCKITQ